MADGYVFVTRSGPVGRSDALVERLIAARLQVVPDFPVHGIEGWPGSYSMAYDAAATVVAFTDDKAEGPLGSSWAALGTGTLLPVKLHPFTVLPAEFAGLVPFDLGDWQGDDSPELRRLIDSCRHLVVRRGYRLRARGWAPALDTRPVDLAQGATTQLQELTGRLSMVGELLLDDNPAAADLNAALDEIGKTYRAVNDAVAEFLSAGSGPADQLDLRTYDRLARDNLRDKIHNGRGSCLRIATLYGRAGGIRSAIQPRTTPELLAAFDAAFAQLRHADGDLFEDMQELGRVLTDEAQLVANLARAGQTELARARMLDAWRRLQPIERQLRDARAGLQEIQIRLGYVERDRTGGGVTVSIQSISINNSTVNAPVGIAQTIQNSWNTVADSPADAELKTMLAELHAAVARMAEALRPDEADLAAEDLRTLGTESVSPTPRPAFWRRAGNGLLDAAKRTAEAGAPVADLVGRIMTLLGPGGV